MPLLLGCFTAIIFKIFYDFLCIYYILVLLYNYTYYTEWNESLRYTVNGYLISFLLDKFTMHLLVYLITKH